MGNTFIDRMEDKCPSWSEWTGAFGTDPLVGTEAESRVYLDMGTVDTSATDKNSNAKALTIEYEADFDDSVYQDTASGLETRLWCANKPLNTLNVLSAEFETGALFPAVSLDAIMAGTTAQEIPGDPFLAMEGGATIYDATNNRIATILLQLACTKIGNVAINQAKLAHGAPYLVVEVPRLNTDSALDISKFTMDTEAGHMFLYTDVQLYIKNANDDLELIGGGQNINSIKEDTIEIETTEEHIKWEKSKPMVAFQTARTSLTTGVNFKLDQCVPAIEALAHQTTVAVDTDRGTLKYSVDAKSSRTKENEYWLRYRTHGGFLMTTKIPRGILTKGGAVTPGGSEFSGTSFHVECLASGPTSQTAETNISRVPHEVSIIPLTFEVTI